MSWLLRACQLTLEIMLIFVDLFLSVFEMEFTKQCQKTIIQAARPKA